MRNISIVQIVILVFLSVLIFSDFSKIKKRLLSGYKSLTVKSRKKGS